MFGIGMTELLVILAVALIVFGPKRLPELARSLGRAIGEFRRASADIRQQIDEVVEEARIEPSKLEPGEPAAAAGKDPIAESTSTPAPPAAGPPAPTAAPTATEAPPAKIAPEPPPRRPEEEAAPQPPERPKGTAGG